MYRGPRGRAIYLSRPLRKGRAARDFSSSRFIPRHYRYRLAGAAGAVRLGTFGGASVVPCCGAACTWPWRRRARVGLRTSWRVQRDAAQGWPAPRCVVERYSTVVAGRYGAAGRAPCSFVCQLIAYWPRGGLIGPARRCRAAVSTMNRPSPRHRRPDRGQCGQCRQGRGKLGSALAATVPRRPVGPGPRQGEIDLLCSPD